MLCSIQLLKTDRAELIITDKENVMKLIHDMPAHKGIENAIKRAKQMTDFRWTPIKDMPAVVSFDNMKQEHEYHGKRLVPWFPQKGMVYSSVLKTQKFVGFNVSFETFVSALSDPDSVLYKYNVDGQGRKNANAWYGVVCSCFVSYVLDMKERWICKNWPTVKNVTMLGQPDVNELRLLDIVLNTKRHIAIVTDILRDENGKVQLIEVSESTLPVCRATYFTPEEFRGAWYNREFNIYRKSDLEGIRYFPSPFVKIAEEPERGIEGDPDVEPFAINKDILPDQGDLCNYKEAQEIVLDLLKEEWDSVEVTAENGEKAVFAAVEHKVIVPMESPMHKPGFYSAKALDSKTGKKSEACRYGITGLTLRAADMVSSMDEKAPVSVKPGQKVAICFENSAPDVSEMIYIHRVSTSGECRRFAITEENRRNGCVTIEFPEEENEFFVFQSADNPYGEYASNYLYFQVKE